MTFSEIAEESRRVRADLAKVERDDPPHRLYAVIDEATRRARRLVDQVMRSHSARQALLDEADEGRRDP